MSLVETHLTAGRLRAERPGHGSGARTQAHDARRDLARAATRERSDEQRQTGGFVPRRARRRRLARPDRSHAIVPNLSGFRQGERQQTQVRHARRGAIQRHRHGTSAHQRAGVLIVLTPALDGRGMPVVAIVVPAPSLWGAGFSGHDETLAAAHPTHAADAQGRSTQQGPQRDDHRDSTHSGYILASSRLRFNPRSPRACGPPWPGRAGYRLHTSLLDGPPTCSKPTRTHTGRPAGRFTVHGVRCRRAITSRRHKSVTTRAPKRLRGGDCWRRTRSAGTSASGGTLEPRERTRSACSPVRVPCSPATDVAYGSGVSGGVGAMFSRDGGRG